MIGIGNEPDSRMSACTSGPGPPSAAAPRTRTPMSASSRTCVRICETPSPSRITSSGAMFCLSRIHFANTSKWASIRSRASARITSPTPIQCWNSSGGMIDIMITPPPVLEARMAANRIAFKHSRLSSNMTKNLRMGPLPVVCSRSSIDARMQFSQASISPMGQSPSLLRQYGQGCPPPVC